MHSSGLARCVLTKTFYIHAPYVKMASVSFDKRGGTDLDSSILEGVTDRYYVIAKIRWPCKSVASKGELSKDG